MKSLTLKKIIIASDIEKASLEIPFKSGLNLILGKNKTGKSSIIKSIFYTFGCELKIDKEWKRVVSRYALIFCYNNRQYIIKRYSNKFSLYETDESMTKIRIINPENSLSSNLMDLFNVNFKWLNNNGESEKVSIAHLLAFQYIDQDNGWNNIGTSFKSLGHIPHWKNKFINYIVGYQTNEYFNAKEKFERISLDINGLNEKINNIQSFIDKALEKKEESKVEYSLKSFSQDAKYILDNLTKIEKERINIKDKLAKKENERYEKQLNILSLSKFEEELELDVKFASKLEMELSCPFCGTKYSNTLEEKVEIIKDIQNSQQMLKLARIELKSLDKEIEEIKKNYSGKNKIYSRLRYKLKNVQEGANIIEALKREGKKEFFSGSNNELTALKNKRNYLLEKKYIYEESLKDFYFLDKKNIIKDEIEKQFNSILEKLCNYNVDTELDGFLVKLDYIGSDLPKAVYAYYISLYLYNLKRKSDLFRFLIIDTPNQQGQDDNNLNNIYSVLDLFCSSNGQVIVGSERETGFEKKATNVIRLKKGRKCLEEGLYDNHKQFFKILENIEAKGESKIEIDKETSGERDKKNLENNMEIQAQINIFDILD